MTKKRPEAQLYYYAGKEKISLQPADDLVALKGKKGAKPGGPAPQGRELTGDLRLLSKAELTASQQKRNAASKYPVFRSHGAIVIALPEVRVEESRRAYWAKLSKWLEEHGDEVDVVSRDDERVVLKPISGSGRDALALANDLAEKVRPEMAQARFIRVTPRPKAKS